MICAPGTTSESARVRQTHRSASGTLHIMPDREANLRRARGHVAEAEKRLAAQRDVVTRLIEDGHSGRMIEAAQAVLHTFEKTVDTMRQHLALEESENAERGPPRN